MQVYLEHKKNTVFGRRTRLATFCVCVLAGIVVNGSPVVFPQDASGGQEPQSGLMILENFQNSDEKGFPQGWEAQRSTVTAHETYTVKSEEGLSFLSARNANQRVYTKNINWDPRKHPILTWRWRLNSLPDKADFIAAVYPSLDVDLMFIPVNTKYVWSAVLPVGSIKEGGMFSSTEIVLRSGTQPLGEWVEERVNVYEDFLKIHNHEPAAKAWGISILGGPGVEVDFASIQVQAE